MERNKSGIRKRIVKTAQEAPNARLGVKIEPGISYGEIKSCREHGIVRGSVERVTRLELATSTLARWRSTR